MLDKLQHLVKLCHTLVDLRNALFDLAPVGGQFSPRGIELLPGAGELGFAGLELCACIGYLLPTLCNLLTRGSYLRAAFGYLPLAVSDGGFVLFELRSALCELRLVGLQLSTITVDLLLAFVKLLERIGLGCIERVLSACDDLLAAGFLPLGLYLTLDAVSHGFDCGIVVIGERVILGRACDRNGYCRVYIAGHAITGRKEHIILGRGGPERGHAGIADWIVEVAWVKHYCGNGEFGGELRGLLFFVVARGGVFRSTHGVRISIRAFTGAAVALILCAHQNG